MTQAQVGDLVRVPLKHDESGRPGYFERFGTVLEANAKTLVIKLRDGTVLKRKRRQVGARR